VFHGTPARKAGSGGAGHKSAKTLTIEKARDAAIAMLTKRLDDLDAWSKEVDRRALNPGLNGPMPADCEATGDLFVGWFGTDDAAARSKIRQRIVKAIAKLNLLHASDFINDPTSNDFAYVEPNTTEHGKYERTVHIGKAFWNSNSDKERAGTLVHEVSHFVTVGGTDDVGSEKKDRAAVDFPGRNPYKYGDPKKDAASCAAYGGARAARLAIKDPTRALENADSFEFFIEGDKAAVILNEHGGLDTEGFGDFPNVRNNRL